MANAARTRIQSGASIVIIAGYVYFSFIILKKFHGQYGDICGIRVCLLHEPLTGCRGGGELIVGAEPCVSVGCGVFFFSLFSPLSL